MMTEFKRTQRDYPLSFKIAVVEQVEKGEMTYKQAQQRYGIQGRSGRNLMLYSFNFSCTLTAKNSLPRSVCKRCIGKGISSITQSIKSSVFAAVRRE